MKKSLEERAAEMRQRQYDPPSKVARRRRSFQKKLDQMAGPDGQVRVQLIPAGKSADVKKVVARMNEALKGLNGLSPEQIQAKISGLTQVLHVKLQLQVNEALDNLSSPDPLAARSALAVIESLMPFITQISELNVKMQVALGLAENKGALVPRRQPTALPASGNDWESKFGDTLTNKSIN